MSERWSLGNAKDGALLRTLLVLALVEPTGVAVARRAHMCYNSVEPVEPMLT